MLVQLGQYDLFMLEKKLEILQFYKPVLWISWTADFKGNQTFARKKVSAMEGRTHDSL